MNLSVPPPKTSIAITPMAFVRLITAAYARRGVDHQSALDWAQITPSQLKVKSARISALQFERLCGYAMKELDDEALGWFSRGLPWGSYGMLARASISSPTLKIALLRWCRHHSLLTADIRLGLEVVDEMATLSITECTDLRAMREFCLLSVLRNILGLACWFIDSDIHLTTVSFPFTTPAHSDFYEIIFKSTVVFGAGRASISFDARYLKIPLQRDESALNTLLQRALPLTVHQYKRDRLLVQRVRQLLHQNVAESSSVEDVASLLNLSVRTLHRHLKDEETTFLEIRDEVRKSLAIALLGQGAVSIKKVAHSVGYDNEKSFFRAFKKWTGMAPNAYLAGAQALSAPGPALGTHTKLRTGLGRT